MAVSGQRFRSWGANESSLSLSMAGQAREDVRVALMDCRRAGACASLPLPEAIVVTCTLDDGGGAKLQCDDTCRCSPDSEIS